MNDRSSRLEAYINIALRGFGKLPPFINQIAEVTDRQVALRFWEFFAGRAVRIPAAIKDDGDELVRAVGIDAAHIIIYFFSVSHDEYVPQGPWCGMGKKWMRVLGLLQENKTIRFVANEVGLSERSVYNIKKKLLDMGFCLTTYRHRYLEAKGDELERISNRILAGRLSGQPYKDIAKNLGVPIGTINRLIQRLRRRGVVVPRGRASLRSVKQRAAK